MSDHLGLIIGLVSVSLLLSCDQGLGLSRHALLLSLPAVPAAWTSLPDLGLEVEWRDERGRSARASAAMGARLAIFVERGRPQAILAIPSSRGRPLRPAGALYPEALSECIGEGAIDLLRLDWPGGYAASIWRILEGGGVDPASFDLSRLVDEALARCSDPWLVDPIETARHLATSSFRVSIYKEPPRFSVQLLGSPWAPESPFPQEAGSISSLPAGLWRFLSPEKELFVSVDEQGEPVLVQF
jgi:hypothetical protein